MVLLTWVKLKSLESELGPLESELDLPGTEMGPLVNELDPLVSELDLLDGKFGSSESELDFLWSGLGSSPLKPVRSSKIGCPEE